MNGSESCSEKKRNKIENGALPHNMRITIFLQNQYSLKETEEKKQTSNKNPGLKVNNENNKNKTIA